MVLLDLFVEFVFTIVQLLADSTAGKPPQRSVAPNLMLIWNQLNGVQRLLRRQLMFVDGILMILGNRTRQAGGENSRFTLGNRGGFFNLPGGYLWSYTGILCSF